MLYQLLLDIAKSYPDKLALNNMTYSQLLDAINLIDYQFIVDDVDYKIILRLFKAAKLDKAVTILPKYNKDKVVLPNLSSQNNFKLIMYSSGSTSNIRLPKTISEKMLLANSRNVIKIQNLNSTSKILSVSSLNHTGGINTQTLPALLAGAHVIVDNFNAFNYSKKLTEHAITHSHLLPANVEALIKNNNILPSSVKLIMIGGDCILKKHIDYLLGQKISVLHAYGMTEAGPPVIFHHWNINDDTNILSTVDETEEVFLGTKCVCDYKVNNNQLYLKGDVIASDNWLATGDCVYIKDNWFIYKGRTSAGCKIIPKA